MLMEQASRAVNRRDRNGPKPPGRMRLWSSRAVAQGADTVLRFPWCNPGAAPRSTTPRCSRTAAPTPAPPRSEGAGAEPDGHRARSLPATVPGGRRLRCRTPDSGLSGYRLVVVPDLYLPKERDGEHLTEFVRGGGRLLVSFYSGTVDDFDRLHLGGYPAPPRKVLGLRVEEFWPAGGDGDRRHPPPTRVSVRRVGQPRRPAVGGRRARRRPGGGRVRLRVVGPGSGRHPAFLRRGTRVVRRDASRLGGHAITDRRGGTGRRRRRVAHLQDPRPAHDAARS